MTLVRHTLVVIFVVFGVMFQAETKAEPSPYTICDVGCNAVWTACVVVAGGAPGVYGFGFIAATLVCNAQQGACMALCIAADVGPLT